MAEKIRPGNTVDKPAQPGTMRSPKRGAIPTPRTELEKAKPYIPEDNRDNDNVTKERSSRENDSGGEKPGNG